jgi:hypothetical protein
MNAVAPWAQIDTHHIARVSPRQAGTQSKQHTPSFSNLLPHLHASMLRGRAVKAAAKPESARLVAWTKIQDQEVHAGQ